MTVAERRDADARRQVEKTVPIDVDEVAAFPAIDGDAGIRRDGLEPGREVLGLTIPQAATGRPRDGGDYARSRDRV
jgi:hypothetical protein